MSLVFSKPQTLHSNLGRLLMSALQSTRPSMFSAFGGCQNDSAEPRWAKASLGAAGASKRGAGADIVV